MRKKLLSLFLTVCIVLPLSSAFNISFAESSDVITGNPVTITDTVTGRTYNYVNFNGKTLVHPYEGMQAWTTDGNSFLCGAPSDGYIYLYNTVENTFTKVGKGRVSDQVDGVIGADDCVYYATSNSINKYDIATGKTTVIIPSSWGYSPHTISITNDCEYIAFSTDRNSSSDWATGDWFDEADETAIFRYHIPTMTLEALSHKFDVSNIVNHHQINPEDPDTVFFAHDGSIGSGEGQVSSYKDIYDRAWTVNFETGEKKNIFKQGINENDQNVVFITHESWGTSGKYLYMNCYSNDSGKGACAIRCYPDGSHREYLKGAATGNISVDHSMASYDDKFTVIDSKEYVYLLSNDTYQQFPIYYSETGRIDPDTGAERSHPYHPHPNVARNHYKVLWGIEHGGHGTANGGVVGVAWYDFTELANEVASGGRYPVNEYIDRVSYAGLDCESENVYYNGYDAIYAKAGNYIYLDISDAVVDGTNEKITVTFDYYDNGEYSGWQLLFNENDPLEVIYTDGASSEADDPYGNDLADSEDAKVEIERDGSKGWESYTLTIDSGNFENINPYRTDLKIGGGGTDAYIANIQVSNTPAASEIYAGGDGTKENPYQIANAAQLKYFTNSVRTTTDKTEVDSNISYTATKVSDTSAIATYTPKRYHVFTNKYFELTDDINLSGETWTPVGNLVNVFNGHFDGNGHTISNVYINGTTPVAFERYAFFGATGANVEITNLGIENLTNKFKGSNTSYSVTINGEQYTYNDRLVGAAGFVSSYAGGTFTNCYIKDAEVRDIEQQMNSGGTGAFFGLGYGTVAATEENGFNAMTVKNCYVNGATLRSHSDSYGFIGRNMAPNTTSAHTGMYIVTKNIENCYTANVKRGYYSGSPSAYDGTMYPFAITSDYTTYKNCYTTCKGEKTTTSSSEATEVEDVVLTTTDNVTLNNNLVDDINYYADVKSVNDGYPIHTDMSEPEVWDGTTDKKPKGDGTEESPFLISTKEELLWVKNSVNTPKDDGTASEYADDYFKLTNDIDYEGNLFEPIGTYDSPFNGHFDGNGHVIKNFKIMAYEMEYADSSKCITPIYQCYGFFGRTGADSDVKDLGIENGRINIWNYDYYYGTNLGSSRRAQFYGGMVGSTSGKFINCYVKTAK